MARMHGWGRTMRRTALGCCPDLSAHGFMSQSFGSAPTAAAVSLASIQREYLEDLKCRVSPSHYRNVKARLDRVAAALQVADLDGLQPLQVIRYRNSQREKGASNRTANLVVDSLGAMLGWAVGCGLIPLNPLKNVRRLPDGAGHQRCRRRAMTDSEIARFLYAAHQ